MKHLFTTAIALLLSLSCLHAQRIHFTDTANRWISYYDEDTYEIYGGSVVYRIKDTAIGDETWSYIAYSTGDMVDPGYAPLIREDTAERKVYARTPFATDSSDYITYVLYDFNMVAGDTLRLLSDLYFHRNYVCDTVYPDEIINGVPHRTFIVEDLFQSGCYFHIIEGIGSLNGPLELLHGCGEWRPSLDCFDNNGEPDTLSNLFDPYDLVINNCHTLGISGQTKLKPVITLTPNPATGILHISMSEPGRDFRYFIHDILGR